MKTIGVLGGLGPQATMDLVARIHRVSQQRIPQKDNAGYPPMLVHYHRHPPILFGEDGVPVSPRQPDPRLLEVAGKLGSWVDFLVIAANAPHEFQEQIEAAAGCRILSMIDVALEEVTRRGLRRVGLLGAGEPKVFMEPLDELGITYEILPVDQRDKLDRWIFKLMEGDRNPQGTRVAIEAVAYLQDKVVDGVILGCTEIPLLLGDQAEQPDLINPTQLLAEAAVAHAIEEH